MEAKRLMASFREKSRDFRYSNEERKNVELDKDIKVLGGYLI